MQEKIGMFLINAYNAIARFLVLVIICQLMGKQLKYWR